MKKVFVLLLSLLMVISLVGCKQDNEIENPEITEPSGEEDIVGGFIDVEDGTLTDELVELFNKAVGGLLGAKYEPVKLVATQVVAGTNYKFLANGTKTTNAITKGTYYVTIYKDLQGNVELKDIEVIEEHQEEVEVKEDDTYIDYTTYDFWVVFYDQYDNELQREALLYGTTPKYKGSLPDGFVKWTYKKTGEDVNNFVPITTNTYFKAVCDNVEPKKDTVKYLDWDGTKLVEKETLDYIEVTNSTTTLSSGFYVVKGDVSTGALFVEGTDSAPTYLILCDGATLTSTCTNGNYAAINVNTDGTTKIANTLVITAPENGTGKLNAYGDDWASAIGSDDSSNGGHITINGGIINAVASEHGAGIGSGECGKSGTITINGGTITATGNSGGAGIGGGGSKSAEVITINGGTITATGNGGGAGIGGGLDGDGGSITINGGTIVADGGDGLGSGIGKGFRGNDGTVTVNGGIITAIGGNAGITGDGVGIGGSISFNTGTFLIKGGTDSSDNEEIGKDPFISSHDYKYVYIEKTEACLAIGTMITMADDTEKPIELLKVGDDIKVFNHEKGELSHSKILDYWHYEEPKYGQITLHFTNDIDVNIVIEHAFYCKEESTYVVLNKDNVNEYIGKHFYNAKNNSWETLVSATYSDEKVDTYYLATEEYYNCVAEGMLTVEDGVYYVICSTFDYDCNMKIDKQKKNIDIMQYGLFTYEDFKYLTEDEFDSHKLGYLKVALEKGLISEADLDLLEYIWTGEKEILENMN